jgi:hypothetical protein
MVLKALYIAALCLRILIRNELTLEPYAVIAYTNPPPPDAIGVGEEL